MIALIQHCSRTSVAVENEIIARIGAGILAHASVKRDDREREANRLIERPRHTHGTRHGSQITFWLQEKRHD